MGEIQTFAAVSVVMGILKRIYPKPDARCTNIYAVIGLAVSTSW